MFHNYKLYSVDLKYAFSLQKGEEVYRAGRTVYVGRRFALKKDNRMFTNSNSLAVHTEFSFL
jgi:hypothetical protein